MTSASQAWGATPGEWAHFSQSLGLIEHLLPVVSNPTARISSRSSMSALGKTPSLYNGEGEVVGIGNWTNLRPSEAKVSSWARQADYGICVQTREVRAFDIDVADPDAAERIEQLIQAHLMEILPTRRRANSGKCLLAVRCVGDDLGKRTIPVAGGMIEFLGCGNQFIACGTHPSGVRYEWDGGVPAEIPEITRETFEDLWTALRVAFAEADSTEATWSVRRRGDHVDVPDPVAQYLEDSGLALDGSDDVRVVVRCPWGAGHSSGTVGDTSSVWFRAGSNGYGQGHYRCLHASCTGRDDDEFKAQVGYVTVTFEPVVLPPEEQTPALTMVRGRPASTITNLDAALRSAHYCGMQLRFDTFRDEIMLAEPNGDQWQQFGDKHYTQLRIHLEGARRFHPVGRELIRDAVLNVATDHKFDTALEWLNRLTWDGVPRVERYFSTYFGTDDTPYTRAVSRYIWTAMAGRVIVPGIKADMVPVLIGSQGARKTTAVRLMAFDPEFFVELSLDAKDDDLARKMRGRLVAELGELKGLHSKEEEAIKQFVSRTHENWIPKYREFGTTFARRLVFIGTTNDEEFLSDRTGNRRWLPLDVADNIDVEGIERDCLQLWAEAAELFIVGGVEYKKAEELATAVHAKHMLSDPWNDIIDAWLKTPDPMSGNLPQDCEFLQTTNVLISALSYDPKHVKRGEQMRMGKVLQALNYTRKKIWLDGAAKWAYIPPNSRRVVT